MLFSLRFRNQDRELWSMQRARIPFWVWLQWKKKTVATVTLISFVCFFCLDPYINHLWSCCIFKNISLMSIRAVAHTRVESHRGSLNTSLVTSNWLWKACLNVISNCQRNQCLQTHFSHSLSEFIEGCAFSQKKKRDSKFFYKQEIKHQGMWLLKALALLHTSCCCCLLY